MLRGQDVLLLLRLLDMPEEPKLLALSRELGLAVATIHRSLARLLEAGLIDESRRARPAQVEEFMFHALRYLFPPRLRGEARGVPTAWAAPPLREHFAPTEGLPPVWPHPSGTVRGIALDPIHARAPRLALDNHMLYGRLAIADALRLGDARLRSIARDELRMLFAVPHASR